MLRWKKQEVKKQSEETSRQPASTVSDESVDEASSGVMVLENVPRSINVVGSHAMPVSAASSVSSDGLHVMGRLTRVSDDETTVSHHVPSAARRLPEDSLGESRVPLNANGDAAPAKVNGSAGEKRKQDMFLRKVSDSDLSGTAEGAKSGDESAPASKRARTSPTMNLLFDTGDSLVLNPLHVFVRKQIEVFTATPTDMAQPAPGRKNPIKLHQVGLRCVHCRHLPARDRVKRAVCYPSSVGRVYHSVSDMKFDHFGNCRGLSQELRAQFETLKVQCKRRSDQRKSTGAGTSSSTAQYYHDAARKMGMVDGGGGIFMAQAMESQQPAGSSTGPATPVDRRRVSLGAQSSVKAPPPFHPPKQLAKKPSFQGSLPPLPAQVLALYQQLPQYSSAFRKASLNGPSPLVHPIMNASRPSDVSRFSMPSICGVHRPQSALLASPLDQQFLNPIHCFVRRNVEVFVATKEDIAAPAPGRKNRVTVGQVGIRCIHCARLPVKDRVKRAVCYPPSVSGIYHSVSNMKFDHFGNCQGLPSEARTEFLTLKTSCTRRGGGSASRGGVSNSTAQYYHDSALRLGLVDTETGIRFREQRLASVAATRGLTASAPDVQDGISALMMAATNPRIRAEFDRRRQVTEEV